MPDRAPPKLRPRLVLWLSCLLLAFTLQIPLAWAFCYFASHLQPEWTGSQVLAPAGLDTDTERISVSAADMPGFRVVMVTAHPPGTLPRRYWEHHSSKPNAADIQSIAAPWHPKDLYPSFADSAAWPDRTGVYSRPNMTYLIQPTRAFAAGWPFLAIDGRVDYDGTTFRFTDIITDPRFCPTPGNDLGYLVYHPRWPAYFANTLIDGTLLTVAILLPTLAFRTLRAKGRARKGLCPHCAYDLRDTPAAEPCPECGRSSSGHPV